MDENLVKRSLIKNHNTIIRLKRVINEKDQKIKKSVKEYQTEVMAHINSQDKKIIELQKKIEEDNKEKMNLEQERNFYKESLNRIPKFIIKLFTKNVKYLEEGKRV